MSAISRDPVSELWDRGARILLERAYRLPAGQWASTRMSEPTAAQRAYCADLGINLDAPDDPGPGRARAGKGLDCRTRWGRAYARALYYQHQWYADGRGGWLAAKRQQRQGPGALELEFGRRLPARGIIPPGRAVRARIRPAAGALDAVQGKSYAARIYDAEGSPAGRHTTAADHDWV